METGPGSLGISQRSGYLRAAGFCDFGFWIFFEEAILLYSTSTLLYSTPLYARRTPRCTQELWKIFERYSSFRIDSGVKLPSSETPFSCSDPSFFVSPFSRKKRWKRAFLCGWTVFFGKNKYIIYASPLPTATPTTRGLLGGNSLRYPIPTHPVKVLIQIFILFYTLLLSGNTL